jgi:hypothetical protein
VITTVKTALNTRIKRLSLLVMELSCLLDIGGDARFFHLMKRIYVGGLTETVTPVDLENLFSRFGSVSDTSVHMKNESRFGYVNVEVTPENEKRMMTLLNGTKWKGATLKVQDAKATFVEKWESKRRTETVTESPSLLKSKKSKAVFVDPGEEKGEGWAMKDGYYVCKFKTRVHNRTKIVDPSRLQNHIRLKLTDRDVSVKDLHFVWDDTPSALISVGLIPTTENFRKRSGIYTEVELEAARMDAEELRKRRLEFMEQLHVSKKPKKEFEEEWMMKQELKQEKAIQESILDQVSTGTSQKGIIFFGSDDEECPVLQQEEQRNPLQIDLSLYDSD